LACAGWQRDLGRETGISESGPSRNRLVGSVSVKAGTISSLASFFFATSQLHRYH
jgi:hypothetical protein